MQAFYYQQPQMLARARELMDDPGLGWREGSKGSSAVSVMGGGDRFAIMSIEEQQALAKCLSEDKRREFLKRRLAFFTEMLRAFGIRAGTRR